MEKNGELLEGMTLNEMKKLSGRENEGWREEEKRQQKKRVYHEEKSNMKVTTLVVSIHESIFADSLVAANVVGKILKANTD